MSADAVTIVGCLLGLTAAVAASFGQFYIALALLIANRIADGLDGAVARATQRTDRGAFLDIVLDFFVYATVPLGFAAWNPDSNALPAAFLLASFVANGSAFLAFSIMAERRGMVTTRHGQKSIYYLAGIAEGFESIRFMVAFFIFPRVLHGCRLHLSKCVSHSRVSFRNPMLDIGSRSSRSRVEAAGSGRLTSAVLLQCMSRLMAHSGHKRGCTILTASE